MFNRETEAKWEGDEEAYFKALFGDPNQQQLEIGALSEDDYEFDPNSPYAKYFEKQEWLEKKGKEALKSLKGLVTEEEYAEFEEKYLFHAQNLYYALDRYTIRIADEVKGNIKLLEDHINLMTAEIKKKEDNRLIGGQLDFLLAAEPEEAPQLTRAVQSFSLPPATPHLFRSYRSAPFPQTMPETEDKKVEASATPIFPKQKSNPVLKISNRYSFSIRPKKETQPSASTPTTNLTKGALNSPAFGKFKR